MGIDIGMKLPFPNAKLYSVNHLSLIRISVIRSAVPSCCVCSYSVDLGEEKNQSGKGCQA